MCSILGVGKFSGIGNGNPLQHSCLENLMDRGAWRATIHGDTEADTTERLSKHMSPYIKYLCVGVYTYTWYMMSQMVTAAMKLKDTCSLEEKL